MLCSVDLTKLKRRLSTNEKCAYIRSKMAEVIAEPAMQVFYAVSGTEVAAAVESGFRRRMTSN
jgi:hypothetical protein